MKYFVYGFVIMACALHACGQKNNKNNATIMNETAMHDTIITPATLYGDLFHEVQMQRIFPDGKTFVDCTPKRAVADIMYDYGMQKGAGMDLKKFVLENFNLPETPSVKVEDNKAIADHIEELWQVLQRKPDVSLSGGEQQTPSGSSLIKLPHAYIVPGGRFREIYYWDSYFTMLGLQVSNRTDIIQNMIDNFAYLINTYGHIPNGNRSYYISRSQPPFFPLMVRLLADSKGDSILNRYLPQLEKEYAYWMEGSTTVKKGEAIHRVVKLKDGSLLNRYFDESNTARPESYREDVETAELAVSEQMSRMRFKDEASQNKYRKEALATLYGHLRAGAASGWDFSTRWFADGNSLRTIQTMHMAPVDLNALLYFAETQLAGIYKQQGNSAKADSYTKAAEARAKAINTWCYNDAVGFYTDYNHEDQTKSTAITAAGLFPLCFLTPDAARCDKAASVVQQQLLQPGGLLTTTVRSGQQWDAPNGWAPLQWMAVWAFERCGKNDLAQTIATRWMQINEDVYKRTGKLMEKYNVVDTKLEAGGGEYAGQDGFGWTNGVYLALKAKYRQ